MLLKNINCDKQHIDKLLSILSEEMHKIILIEYNYDTKLPFYPVTEAEMSEIFEYITSKGFESNCRRSKGVAIAGGCGQFVGKID